MSGTTGIVSSTPAFVPGTFDAQDARLATMGNCLPGVFAVGDFAVSERAAGANMSVDIAAGRCYVDPGDADQQGVYLARLAAADAPFNTSADGGYTWTAAHATLPRIDIIGVEVADQDFAGTYTGFKFRVIDGTPNAGATDEMLTAYWPAIPAGVVALAAVRVPAAATTITTANITNLNQIGGERVTAVPTVSVLPGDPYDGQEIVFQTAAMALQGVAWRLRYNASSANAEKWEAIGGPDLTGVSAGGNEQTTDASTYTTILGTPSHTAPVDGVYEISAAGSISQPFGGLCEARVALGINGAASTIMGQHVSADQYAASTPSSKTTASLDAGDVVTLMAATNNTIMSIGGMVPWRLNIAPIRLG